MAKTFESAKFGNKNLLSIIALYVLIAVIVAPASYASLLFFYLVTHIIALPILMMIGFPLFAFISAPKSPVRYIVNVIREKGSQAGLVVVVFFFGITAFTTLKQSAPMYIPFFADQTLANIDDYIHFGPPWRFLHAVTPEVVVRVLAFFYTKLWFFEWLGILLFVAFYKNGKLRSQYLLAFALSIILLATLLRIMMESAGPIFYDRLFGSDRYSELVQALSASPAASPVLLFADYLFDSYSNAKIGVGTGIAAMPSMHVAFATLSALFLQRINRIAGALAWFFMLAILYGSVYFGWHYALDGYVGILGMVLVWRWAGHLVLSGSPEDSESRQAMEPV